MPQDHWIIDGPRMLSSPLMQIATADANRRHFHQDILIAKIGEWNFL
jgi:hypothetical protein